MAGLLSEGKNVEEVVCDAEDRAVRKVELVLPYGDSAGPEAGSKAGPLTGFRGVDPLPCDHPSQPLDSQPCLHRLDHLMTSPLHQCIPVLAVDVRRRGSVGERADLVLIGQEMTDGDEDDDRVLALRGGRRITAGSAGRE
jgi:hypothetical protein